MRVTFAKDLGLTVVYLKKKIILVKSIGPAAAGPAGPVPAPLPEMYIVTSAALFTKALHCV